MLDRENGLIVRLNWLSALLGGKIVDSRPGSSTRGKIEVGLKNAREGSKLPILRSAWCLVCMVSRPSLGKHPVVLAEFLWAERDWDVTRTETV